MFWFYFSSCLFAGGDAWHNWAGTITAQPGTVHYPQSRDDIVQIVKDAGQCCLLPVFLTAGHHHCFQLLGLRL